MFLWDYKGGIFSEYPIKKKKQLGATTRHTDLFCIFK